MIQYLIILAISLVFIYLILYLKKNNSSVPTIPDALFFYKNLLVGLNMKDLFQRIVYIGECTNELGGLTKFSYGPVEVYVVTDPEDASTISTQCMKKMFVYSLIESYVGDQLIAASVPVWKTNRRLLDHAFKQNVLDSYIELFNRQGTRLTVALADEVNKEFDVTEMITRNMLETVCQTVMGINVNGQDIITDSYAKAIDRLLEIMALRVIRPWLLLNFIFNWSNLKKEQDEHLKQIFNFSDQMVKQRKRKFINRLKNKELIDSKEEELKSCLDIMIEHTVTEDTEMLTDLQMRQIIDNLLLAGFDTITPQLVYALVCIGSYPDVQRKIYNEVVEITGTEDKLITKQDLNGFTYLEAVLKEVLRLYPIGPIIARTSTSDVQLKNHVLPENRHVIIHLWAINRNKKYWGYDADEFRPERWFEDSVPSHPAAYSSFSLGRRNCIGKSYVMVAMKIILAKIIKKYTIYADDKKIVSEFTTLLKPSSGHLIKIEPR